MVDEISDEYGDYRINFMHPHGPARQFPWPLRKDPCWIPKDDILQGITFEKVRRAKNRSLKMTIWSLASDLCYEEKISARGAPL